MSHFPLIDISGAPFERGVQYGKQAVSRINISLSIYREAFARSGYNWPAVREVAAQFMPRIEAYAPRMLEEIVGIAKGCDVPTEDIIALNARTEMMHGNSRPEDVLEETDEGCTGAIVLPEITARGTLLHGQNWDWQAACENSAIVLRIRRDDGPDILTMVEAGMLARCGFNSAGLAITGNFLKCQHDFGRAGIPVPLVRRAVLEEPNYTEAIRKVLLAPRSFSTIIMMSHVEGEGVDLEATPPEVFWVRPQNGLLVHANHFVSVGAQAKMTDLGLHVTPDSLHREDRVRNMLSAKRGAIDVADLKQAFADRRGAPHAVCRSPVEGPGGGTSSTVATIIMDVTERSAIIAPAPYRGAVFWKYDLSCNQPTPEQAQ
jgi:isopenicillin-N N-acyltransferase-like protein